jgi:hypothetical protein
MQGVIETALSSLTTPTRLANERRARVYLKRCNRSKLSLAAIGSDGWRHKKRCVDAGMGACQSRMTETLGARRWAPG